MPSLESQEIPLRLLPTARAMPSQSGSRAWGMAMPGAIHELTILSRCWIALVTVSASRLPTDPASSTASSRMAPSFARLRRVRMRPGAR